MSESFHPITMNKLIAGDPKNKNLVIMVMVIVVMVIVMVVVIVIVVMMIVAVVVVVVVVVVSQRPMKSIRRTSDQRRARGRRWRCCVVKRENMPRAQMGKIFLYPL
jgi:Flp pilus assembly protein TadB